MYVEGIFCYVLVYMVLWNVSVRSGIANRELPGGKYLQMDSFILAHSTFPFSFQLYYSRHRLSSLDMNTTHLSTSIEL